MEGRKAQSFKNGFLGSGPAYAASNLSLRFSCMCDRRPVTFNAFAFLLAALFVYKSRRSENTYYFLFIDIYRLYVLDCC